jgi:hypothetical protein
MSTLTVRSRSGRLFFACIQMRLVFSLTCHESDSWCGGFYSNTAKNKRYFLYWKVTVISVWLGKRQTSLYKRHQCIYGDWRYNSTCCATSALDGGELSASRPGRFTPRRRVASTNWLEHSIKKIFPRKLVTLLWVHREGRFLEPATNITFYVQQHLSFSLLRWISQL